MTAALAAGDVARILAIVAPDDDIAEWIADRDVYPVTTPSTESLDRVIAAMASGRRLRVFVKTIHSLRHWPMIGMIPEAIREAAFAQFPWRVEAEVYGSALLDDLPDGLRAPRIYAIDDLGDERLRIWMEDLSETPVPWDLARYATAAHCLGRLAGRSLRTGLPEGGPRLAPGLHFIFDSKTTVFDIPALRSEDAWRHPLAAAVSHTDPALRGDLIKLADEAPAIGAALDRLPHALAHGDACPQNLLADPLRHGGLVAIDWGFTSLAPLGYDLGQLLIGRVENGAVGESELPAIHDAILPAYLAGLAEEQVGPTAAEVRRGFIGGLLLRSVFTALPLEWLRRPISEDAAGAFMRRARYARYLLELRHDVAVGF